jgi:hypothetical protein
MGGLSQHKLYLYRLHNAAELSEAAFENGPHFAGKAVDFCNAQAKEMGTI